jgi:hypothetical protein
MVSAMLSYRSLAAGPQAGVDTKVWPDTIVQLRGPLYSGRMV